MKSNAQPRPCVSRPCYTSARRRVSVDTRTGVNDADYQLPFRFIGKLDKLTVKLGPPQPPAELVEIEKKLLERAEQRRAREK
jgi:hypothetical protein